MPDETTWPCTACGEPIASRDPDDMHTITEAQAHGTQRQVGDYHAEICCPECNRPDEPPVSAPELRDPPAASPGCPTCGLRTRAWDGCTHHWHGEMA